MTQTQITHIKHIKLKPSSIASYNSGLEMEWDYSGKKGKVGQKKKIVKSQREKVKVKKSKG